MMSKKYHMINWVDGMKIRKEHFAGLQHAVNQRVMASVSTRLSAITYGLLAPSPQDGSPPYKLDIEVENENTIQVTVFSCRAATPGGFIIDIGNADGQPCRYTLEMPAGIRRAEGERQRYVLVLSANPFNGKEIGEPDPEEVPPRRPYIQPAYQLGLLPKETAEGREVTHYGSLNLGIGEIIVDPSRIYLDENYIPPCTTVYSSPRLIEVHTKFYQSLRKLETLCLRINRKIVAREQDYALAVMVYRLSEEILFYLGTVMYRFRGVLRYGPPADMFEILSSLARLVKNSIEIYQGTGKEELINYFVEWCDLNQGQFEKVISRAADLRYDHAAISETVEHSSHFLEQLVGLYTKLDELDYIGRKSGKDIFVKEEKRNSASTKNRINFLVQ